MLFLDVQCFSLPLNPTIWISHPCLFYFYFYLFHLKHIKDTCRGSGLYMSNCCFCLQGIIGTPGPTGPPGPPGLSVSVCPLFLTPMLIAICFISHFPSLWPLNTISFSVMAYESSPLCWAVTGLCRWLLNMHSLPCSSARALCCEARRDLDA